MVIGERIVVADIAERKKARELYEQAKAAGQKTALMEQERPNIFTNSVANIGPHETVVVQVEYQEPVRQSGGVFTLRLPLVVAPRYNPTPLVQTVDLGGNGFGTCDRSGARSRPHRAAGARSAQARAGQSGQHHGAPQRRLCARHGQEPPSQAWRSKRLPTTPASSSLPMDLCRPIATSS
jgi:hypothetical protein